MGQRGAIYAHKTQDVGVGIHHQAHIAGEAETLGRIGRADRHALALRCRCHRRGHGCQFPARPGRIRIQREASGVDAQIAAGLDTAAPLQRRLSGDGQGQVRRRRPLPCHRHGSGNRQLRDGAARRRCQVEEPLEIQVAERRQLELSGGEDGPAQIGQRPIDQQRSVCRNGDAGGSG